MSVEIEGVQYVTARDLLEDLAISRQTLWRWRQEGKVPVGHRYRDGQVLFTEAEAAAITQHANRIEPVARGYRGQLKLFNGQ